MAGNGGGGSAAGRGNSVYQDPRAGEGGVPGTAVIQHSRPWEEKATKGGGAWPCRVWNARLRTMPDLGPEGSREQSSREGMWSEGPV